MKTRVKVLRGKPTLDLKGKVGFIDGYVCQEVGFAMAIVIIDKRLHQINIDNLEVVNEKQI